MEGSCPARLDHERRTGGRRDGSYRGRMAARGHGAGRRWAVVGALVVTLIALPPLLRLLPASDRDVSAAGLRTRALATEALGFSGYAVSAGSLALPVTEQLSTVADLFSSRTSMRVWWRGPVDNRVDVVTPAGEIGTHRGAAATWTWEYETATATRSAANPLDLPAPPDVLPSSLGRRLLSEATDGELARAGARRVAGRDALGLRLTPAAAASSVRRVDVWIDAATGLPLQVQVFETGAARSALDTRFLDLDLAVPPAHVTAFTPPPGAAVREGREAEVVLEAGRRSSAPASPSRCRIPSEYALTGRRPTPPSPTWSRASSTRRRRVRHEPPRPEASSSERFSRPERCP